ncbi:hypothetical protein ACSHWB_14745 [Lentzea sp. HUAS TT2]|uniref:hypothetical protein n=1 Tax=Lentzea sp. HUAS TT2 TaxID=3447454 RepID=UPI003F72C1BE
MAATAYPKIPSKAWRLLRSKATLAPSTKFTPSIVAAMLEMASPKSASDNIVGPLRRMGLVTDDGGLTPRGGKWRVDASYSEACQEILDEFYPGELTALVDENGAPDKSQVLTWFQHQGFGGSNATQMCATYLMIASKKIPEPPNSDSKSKATTKKPAPKKSTPGSVSNSADHAESSAGKDSDARIDNPAQNHNSHHAAPNNGPNVHLDIQIHIPADASPEQIDSIFASMAKHLYQK